MQVRLGGGVLLPPRQHCSVLLHVQVQAQVQAHLDGRDQGHQELVAAAGARLIAPALRSRVVPGQPALLVLGQGGRVVRQVQRCQASRGHYSPSAQLIYS